MDIFEAQPSEELETIAQLLRERHLVEAEVLCRHGDPGDALFIVTGGRIRLSTTDPSGNETVLAYFTDGQFFGEMSLLTGAPRSATATAESDSQVLVLDKDAFDTLSVGAGRVYAIFSPRGGSGKTTLAVNIAVQHALEQPECTALVDLSLTFGHAAALLDLEPETSLAAVPAGSLSNFDRRTLGTYLLEHPTSLQLLVAGTRPEEGERVTAAHVRAALGAMKRQFSATFVDCGSGFDEPTIAALEMADAVMVICTPELNSLRDVRECQRVFGEIIRLDMKRVCFVFNHNQPFSVLGREQFESALEQPMNFELPHAGEAAYRAANRGEPLVLAHSGSGYSKAVERMRRTLVPIEAKIEPKRRFSVVGGGQGHSQATQSRSRGGMFGALRGKRAS
jgi:Flp pilus assembly CpaE family ATPase